MDNSNSSTVIKVDSAAEEVPPLAEKTANKKGNEEERAEMTANKKGKRPLEGEEVDSAAEEVHPLAEKTPNKKGNEEERAEMSANKKGKRPLEGEEVDSAAEEVPPLAEKTPNKKGNEEDRAEMTANKKGKGPLYYDEEERYPDWVCDQISLMVKEKWARLVEDVDETEEVVGYEEDEADNTSKKKGKRPLEGGEEDVAAEKTAKKKRSYFRGLLCPYNPVLHAPPPPGVPGDCSYYPSSSSALFSEKATFKKGLSGLDVLEKNTHLPFLQRFDEAIEPCSTSSETESSSSDDSDDAGDSEPTWAEAVEKLRMLIRSQRNEQKKE